MKKTNYQNYRHIFFAIFIFFLTFLGFVQIGKTTSEKSNFAELTVALLIGVIAYFLSNLLLQPEGEKGTKKKDNPVLQFESLSHPLLLKMSWLAPGTFHHAINVSILAQRAAEAIGADALLVRVAAYYHDLGKIGKPSLFIENQSGEEIPRSEEGKEIKDTVAQIINHVDAGVLIATKNKMPGQIIDLIAEHHGTTKVIYFYEKAKEQGLAIKQTDFRYTGPAPQSREAAVLMLADSVEAAARSVAVLTRSVIAQIVENTIKDKLGLNQFAQAGLRQNDLEMMKTALIEALGSIYHQRIQTNEAN